MFEDLSSSVVDLELGPSGEVVVVNLGKEVIVVSQFLMFVSTLDVCMVTYGLLVSYICDSIVAFFHCDTWN